VELSTFPNSKMEVNMEANLELSIMELYYSTKPLVCECEKGSVCEEFAIGK
jgi:hypothetical protein